MLRSSSRLATLCAAAVLAACSAPVGPQPAPPLRDADAAALERRADARADLGQRDLAAPLYARAIEVRAQGSGPPAHAARALAALAVIQHDRGHLVEAEHFYRRALASEESDGGGDPELRRRVLANLGSLLRASSRPEEALVHLDRARELAARETPGLAWILGESAAACAAVGRIGDAADHYRRALAIWEPLQPESRSLVAETLANLALLHRARGEHAEARALLERAVPLYERELGPEAAAARRARALLEETARTTAPADLP